MQKERVEHINVINWFRYQYPKLTRDLHHFANERRCSVQEGRMLKRMGVMKGVSDFFLAIPCNGYHGLWIELKVNEGKLSPEQVEFLARKNELGYHAIAVWGFQAATEVIKIYLRGCYSNRDENEPKKLYNCVPLC